jgi:hypothetical protein
MSVTLVGHIKGITNHVTLLDLIDQWLPGYGRVCLVTFNYDLLIEHALDFMRIAIHSLSDYISHPRYKLIKAHGSINWGREVRSPVIDFAKSRIEELEFADEFVWTGEHDMGRLPNQGMSVFPALAIPLVTKLDFECPKAHQEVLRECIPAVSKLLVIGWRGAEKHFVELLSNLDRNRKIPGLVVAGDRGRASEVIVGLSRASDRITWSASEGGFSDFGYIGEEVVRARGQAANRAPAHDDLTVQIYPILTVMK